MVTILAGDGGRGKSTLMLDIAARVTTGRPMPDEEKGFRPGAVIVFSAEDHLRSVLVPRLELAGADRRLVLELKASTVEGGERELVIEPGDLDLIEKAIQKESVSLVIFDPMVAFVASDTDLHRNQDARRVLGRLHGVAERTGCAIVGIHHFNRGIHRYAVNRLTGSAGIANASRSVLVVGPDPDDEDRMVLALAKHNLAPRGVPSLGYRLVPTENPDHPRIEWGAVIAISANDLLAVPPDPDERCKLAQGREYLRKALARVWVPEKDLERDAPCSERTLREAKRIEGVLSKRADGRWLWGLPGTDQIPSGVAGLQPCSLDGTPPASSTLGQGCKAAGDEPLSGPDENGSQGTTRAVSRAPTNDDCSRCGAALSPDDCGFLCASCAAEAS